MKENTEVLLIEDNTCDAELTIRALKKNNFGNSLLHLRDGAEALDFLFAEDSSPGAGFANPPKLILLDIKMPKVNGIEVLARIRSNVKTRAVPVIMLTSSREDPDIQECYRLGADGFVVKPVDFHMFHKAIADIGLYWVVVQPACYEHA